MDIDVYVSPAKKLKSCDGSAATLPLYNLNYEERDLQEITLDSKLSVYICNTLVKPYNLHCILCNKTCSDEVSVISHINSQKHLGNQKRRNDSIGIISKEFNTFIICCLSDLIAFVHVYFKAHKLNELVVANKEFIFSENSNHFGGEPETCSKIVVNSPGFIPSVTENTVYFRVIVDREDSRLYFESRAARYSHLTGNIVIETKGTYAAKIAYVYELFIDRIQSLGLVFVDINDWCNENIPPTTLVWCSFCCKSLTIQSLFSHLDQDPHTFSSSPFLYALMCHKCETFFLNIHGDKIHHVHTRCVRKYPVKIPTSRKFNAVHLMSGISSEAIELYVSDFIKRFPIKKSDLKFECLLCYSPLVNFLSEFINHLKDPSHLDNLSNECKKFVAFCDSCNILLIAQNVNRLFDHLEVHCNPSKMLENKQQPSTSAMEDSNILSECDVLPKETNNMYDFAAICPKIVNFSETAFQVTSPGVQDDFNVTRDLTIENIEEYINEIYYSIYSDIKKIYFVCSNCSEVRMDKSSYYNHLKNRKHLMKIRPHLDQTFFAKICDICQIFLLASSIDLIKKHFSSSEHYQNVKYRMDFIKQQFLEHSGNIKLGWSGILTEKCRTLFSSGDSLHCHVDCALKEAEDINKSAQLVHGILEKDIKRTLEPILGKIEINFFGSRIYGLAQQDSDVDICLNLDEKTVDDLEKGFSESASLFTIKETIKEARVPIIKLEHIYTSLNCDINCCDSAAVYDSQLIRVYISLDYRVQWVLMAVKLWATANQIRGTKKITSYGLTWLTLFFLMQPDIYLVPPVILLKKLHEGSNTIIKGWNYSFTTDIDTIKLHHNPSACTKNKFELLYLFFQYYAMLKGKKVVLVPLTGEVFPRSVLASSESHFCQELALNSEDTEPIRIGGQYMLLNCFRLRDNVLKNVDENLADHFRLICEKTIEECCWSG